MRSGLVYDVAIGTSVSSSLSGGLVGSRGGADVRWSSCSSCTTRSQPACIARNGAMTGDAVAVLPSGVTPDRLRESHMTLPDVLASLAVCAHEASSRRLNILNYLRVLQDLVYEGSTWAMRTAFETRGESRLADRSGRLTGSSMPSVQASRAPPLPAPLQVDGRRSWAELNKSPEACASSKSDATLPSDCSSASSGYGGSGVLTSPSEGRWPRSGVVSGFGWLLECRTGCSCWIADFISYCRALEITARGIVGLSPTLKLLADEIIHLRSRSPGQYGEPVFDE